MQSAGIVSRPVGFVMGKSPCVSRTPSRHARWRTFVMHPKARQAHECLFVMRE
jgi:hypothetical protein